MIRILILLLLLATPAHAEIAGQARVIDGDTLEIQGQRIRLEGIDAPESNQWCLDAQGEGYPCGRVASFALADLIGRKHVRCDVVGFDQYERALGVCHLGEIELNEWMVAEGYALAFLRYSQAYVRIERTAEKNGAGMWQGRFDTPWDFRNAEPTIGQGGKILRLASDRDCQIKGNINRKGDRIFHSPGQQHYDRTQINEAQGERWFCSAEEAEAAGWRAAKR